MEQPFDKFTVLDRLDLVGAERFPYALRFALFRHGDHLEPLTS